MWEHRTSYQGWATVRLITKPDRFKAAINIFESRIVAWYDRHLKKSEKKSTSQ